MDRNVVSLCKQILNGQKKVGVNRKRELKKLNKPSNQISSLFSIIEGSQGIKESKEQKEQTLLNETSIIRRFFKKAKTDSDFLYNCKEEFSEVFSQNDVEINAKHYIKFIFEMHDILYQSISRRERSKIKNKIFEIAKQYEIDLEHIVVISSLAVLYGNNIIRKIFKFKNLSDTNEKNKLVYNAYNDLMVISRFVRMKQMLLDNNRKDKLEYFTFDNALNSFLKSVVADNSNLEYSLDGSSSLQVQTIYPKSIFVDLSDEEVDNLYEEINL